MAEFVCMAFEHVDAADKALIELQLLQQDGLAELADACVVRRSATGDVRLKQSVNLVVGGMVGGGVLGAACSTLFMLLRRANVEKLLARLERYRPVVLRPSSIGNQNDGAVDDLGGRRPDRA